MKFAIVTPIWKETLSEYEFLFLKITSSTNISIEKYFLSPEELDISLYKKHFPSWKILRISGHHLSSIESYNHYMLLPDLYNKLLMFEFTAICQTDAVLIRDISSIDLGDIDYVGSVWKKPDYTNWFKVFGLRYLGKIFEIIGFREKLIVGNGGLSIRRNDTFRRITKKMFYSNFIKIHEDKFYSFLGRKGVLRCASPEFSEKIFRETTAISTTNLQDIYGFHALKKWNPQLLKKVLQKHI